MITSFFELSTYHFCAVTYTLRNSISLHLLIDMLRSCILTLYGINRSNLVTQKMLRPSYGEELLKSALHKFYGHRHELFDRYDMFVSVDYILMLEL